MPLRRGTAYRYQSAAGRSRVLVVVTNDDWNETMEEVGVVSLVSTPVAPSMPPPLVPQVPSLHGYAAGVLLSVPRDTLQDIWQVLDQAAMASIEDALVGVLGLPDLLSAPPRLPPGAPGRAPCPWGEVHFGLRPVGAERKRYLTVSIDAYNAAGTGRIVVRTTSSDRRHGRAFPTIGRTETGTSVRACVGNATTFPLSALLPDARQRPEPPRYFTAALASIADAFVETHQLSGALGRARPFEQTP